MMLQKQAQGTDDIVNIASTPARMNAREIGRDTFHSPFCELIGGNDIENHSPTRPPSAALYKFRPSAQFPKLRLLSSPTNIGIQVTLKAVVRRESVVIVTEKQGEWWHCTCSGYVGWANVTGDMLSKNVFIPIKELRRFEDWRGEKIISVRK